MTSDSDVNWKSRFKWAGSCMILFFTKVIRFKIKHSGETALGRFMDQQNLQYKNVRLVLCPTFQMPFQSFAYLLAPVDN